MHPTAPADPAVTRPTASTVPAWVGAAAFGVVLSALFAFTFVDLVKLWERDPNYNHGFLVLPIALALGVRTYLRTAGPVGPPDRRLGWFAVLLGGFAHLTAMLFVVPLIDFLALFFLARGGLLMAGGRGWASAFNFPLGFLVFLFPLPPTWLSAVALWLQDIAARVSETVLGLFVVVSRDGHTIRIAGLDDKLVVAEECSGTRQIVAFVALAALYGHLTGRHWGYKLLLLLLSVPVAVFANVLRVVLMNLGAYWFGTKWMSGWMHDVPALFSLPVGLAAFFVIDRTLTRIFAPPAPATDAPAGEPAKPAVPPLPADFTRRWVPAVAGGLALVALSLLLQWHLSAADERSFPQVRAAFETLPLRFPTDKDARWVSQEMDPSVRTDLIKTLPFHADDLMFRRYLTADKAAYADLYMVHSRNGEDRNHHPEICMGVVSGKQQDSKLNGTVTLAAGMNRHGSPWAADAAAEAKEANGRKAQRLCYKQGGSRSVVVYYWHYTFTPETLARSPLRMIHQQIGKPAPSVTVQVTVPYDERHLQAVETVLLPQLDAFLCHAVLPPNTLVGCDRMPVAFVDR